MSKRTRSEKNSNTADDLLISQAKAAELCGMTRAAIHDLVVQGKLDSVEVEGRPLVFLRQVEVLAAEKG